MWIASRALLVQSLPQCLRRVLRVVRACLVDERLLFGPDQLSAGDRRAVESFDHIDHLSFYDLVAECPKLALFELEAKRRSARGLQESEILRR